MNNTILIMFLLIFIFLIVFKVNGYLNNKYKNRRFISKIFMTVFLVCMLTLYCGLVGIRLTPLQASKANSFIEKKAEFLQEIKVGKTYLHIYYSPKENKYLTTYTEPVGIFYRSNSSTWYYSHEEDKIRTLGGTGIANEEGYELVLYIENRDPEVSEIAIIDTHGNYECRQPIKVGEKTIFRYKYPTGAKTFDYKVVALNSKSDVLYYYGNELNDNHTRGEEYKWHVMKAGESLVN